MNCDAVYSAITNDYQNGCQRAPVSPLLMFDVDSRQRLRQLAAYAVQLDNVGIDLSVRLTDAEGNISSLDLSQALQDDKLEALDLSQAAQDEQLVDLETSQTQQDTELAALNTSQALQTDKIEVLETGFLPSGRIYSEAVNGGAAFVIKQNGEATTDLEGNPTTVPVSAEIATYDGSDIVQASVLLQNDLVTIGPNVRIVGDLLLGDSTNTVQAQLDDLEERILQEVIALASNYALVSSDNMYTSKSQTRSVYERLRRLRIKFIANSLSLLVNLHKNRMQLSRH
jgi:hypothetical protein